MNKGAFFFKWYEKLMLQYQVPWKYPHMSSICLLPIKPLQPEDGDHLLQQWVYQHVLCVDIPLFLDGRLPPILQEFDKVGLLSCTLLAKF